MALKRALRRLYRMPNGQTGVYMVDAATGEIIPQDQMSQYDLTSDTNTDISSINIGPDDGRKNPDGSFKPNPGDPSNPATTPTVDTGAPASNNNGGNGSTRSSSFDNQARDNAIGLNTPVSGTVEGGLGGLMQAAQSIGLFTGGGILGKILGLGSNDKNEDGTPKREAPIDKVMGALFGGNSDTPATPGLSNTPPTSGPKLVAGEGNGKVDDPARVTQASAQEPTATPASAPDKRLAQVSVETNGVRRLPVKQDLINQVQASVTAVYGAGFKAVIASGAQPAGPEGTPGTVGTRRHGTGVAADVRIYAPDGTELKKDQLLPLSQDWLAQKKGSVGFPSNGTSFLHLDLIGGTVPGSVPLAKGEGKVWSYGQSSSYEKNVLHSAIQNGVTPKYVVDPKVVAQIQATNGAYDSSEAQLAQGRTSPIAAPAPRTQVATLTTGQNSPITAPPVADTGTRVGFATMPPTMPQGQTSPILAKPPGVINAQTVNVSPDGTERPVDRAGDVAMAGTNRMGEQLAGDAAAINNPQIQGQTSPVTPVAQGQTSPVMPNTQVQGQSSPVTANNPAMGQTSPVNGAMPAMGQSSPVAASNPAIGQTSPITAPNTNIQRTDVTKVGTVDPTSNPTVKAYLAKLNKFEGSPAANQTFGFGSFSDMSQHPNVYDKKYNTTAAGLYQINNPTWQEYSKKVGVSDFSADSQAKVAWKIAQDNYAIKTGGGDLYSALTSTDPAIVATAFTKNANRWASLPKTMSAALGTANEFMADTASFSAEDYAAPSPSEISTGLVDSMTQHDQNHQAGSDLNQQAMSPSNTANRSNPQESDMGFANHNPSQTGTDTNEASGQSGRLNNKVSPDISPSTPPANHNYPADTMNQTGNNNTAFNNVDTRTGVNAQGSSTGGIGVRAPTGSGTASSTSTHAGSNVQGNTANSFASTSTLNNERDQH